MGCAAHTGPTSNAAPVRAAHAPDADQYPRSFPAQQQQPPGLTDEMVPKPDHGENSYQGSNRLAGMRALVTGGDSGIGRAVAIAYAREGADVAVTHMPEEQVDGNATAALISDAGRRALAVAADLTDERLCRDTVLGPRGVRVNAVAPGPIWTPLQPATQPGAKLQSFGQDTPLGRAGQPAEVAPAFVFLASPADASYVSGTVLGVTGGKPVF